MPHRTGTGGQGRVDFVLAAGTAKEGPGPLVSAFAGQSAGINPIPVTIVPGSLSDDEIDALG